MRAREALHPVVVCVAVLLALACTGLASCDRARPVTTPEVPENVDVLEGEGVTVWVVPPAPHTTLAETVVLDVSAQFDESIEISPADAFDGLDGLRLLERRTYPSSLTETRMLRQRWSYEFEPLTLGEVVIPPIRMAYRDRGSGELGFVESTPYRMVVASVLGAADTLEISGFRAVAPPPPREQSFGQAMRNAIAGVIVGLAVLGLLGWLFARWIRRGLRQSGIPRARRRIEAMRRKVPGASGRDLRDMLSEGGSLVRACISEKAEIAAHSMTPAEIATACPELEKVDDSIELMLTLERTIYAPEDPMPSETSELLAWCSRVVDDMATFVPTRFLPIQEVGV